MDQQLIATCISGFIGGTIIAYAALKIGFHRGFRAGYERGLSTTQALKDIFVRAAFETERPPDTGSRMSKHRFTIR